MKTTSHNYSHLGRLILLFDFFCWMKHSRVPHQQEWRFVLRRVYSALVRLKFLITLNGTLLLPIAANSLRRRFPPRGVNLSTQSSKWTALSLKFYKCSFQQERKFFHFLFSDALYFIAKETFARSLRYESSRRLRHRCFTYIRANKNKGFFQP